MEWRRLSDKSQFLVTGNNDPEGIEEKIPRPKPTLYLFIHSFNSVLFIGIYVVRITGLCFPHTLRYFKTDLQEVGCEGRE